MREILVRGKRVDNGKWVYGFLLESGRETYIIRTNEVLPSDDWDYIKVGGAVYGHLIEVDPNTVGQFTGKHFDNPKKGNDTTCFDGDIAFDEHELDGRKVKLWFVCTWVDEWARFAWLHVPEYLLYKKDGIIYEQSVSMLEMNDMHYTGNIHENPELIQ